MNDEKKSSPLHGNIVCRQTAAVGDPYSEAFGLFREWECRSSWGRCKNSIYYCDERLG